MARPDGRTAHQAVFWQLFVDGALRHPWTWIAGNGQAVSVWIPPNATELSEEQEQRLEELVAQYLTAGAHDFHELVARFEAAHPRSQPHYYLSLLGTHPDHRGNGIGMRLLAHNLALIDAEHMPAYLESSNAANNRRYESVGFEAIGGFTFPRSGPPVTTMWRSARPPS
jgi:GNAT superfamily N-acetyltransferase